MSFASFFKGDPAIKKVKERKAEAEEILRNVRLSPKMAKATTRGLQINSPFQLPLITKEMWMEGCPCTQKSRHWKGIMAFQDEYFRSKNSESFISSYNESFHAGLMKQLFAPLPRSIAPDVSSIHMRSSGSFRHAKIPNLSRTRRQFSPKKKIFALRTPPSLP